MSAVSCVNVSTYINTFVKIQVQVIADVCGATLEIEQTLQSLRLPYCKSSSFSFTTVPLMKMTYSEIALK